MKEDLISIIIPVYNAEKYIKQTIKTIKAQTYKNWEAIFVDDCSKDKSAGIIKKEESDKISEHLSRLMELTAKFIMEN